MTKLKKKSIQAVGERVIVKPIPHETTTASGIILPATANRHKIRSAEVVSLGDPDKLKSVKPGDVVFLAEFAGSPIEVDGVEHLVVQAAEILAKVV